MWDVRCGMGCGIGMRDVGCEIGMRGLVIKTKMGWESGWIGVEVLEDVYLR